MTPEQLTRKVELEALPELHWMQKKELAKLQELAGETAPQEQQEEQKKIKQDKVSIMTKQVKVQYLMKSNVYHNGTLFSEKTLHDSVPDTFLSSGFAEPVETIL